MVLRRVHKTKQKLRNQNGFVIYEVMTGVCCGMGEGASWAGEDGRGGRVGWWRRRRVYEKLKVRDATTQE